jgi:hypothetical protein
MIKARLILLLLTLMFGITPNALAVDPADKYINKILPINDHASGAITINTDVGCTGAIYTNVGATQSAGEPVATCSSTTGYATVWYKFSAPPGGAVRISTAAGAGNTLTNSRVALFSAIDVNDYATFNIIACDEDGGSGSFGAMSVFYATGLTVDDVYYIQVDKFDGASAEGTFCLTVEKLNETMLSVTDNCASIYQAPVGSVASYKGWVSLLDDNSKLIAIIKNPAGGPANSYTVVQNANAAAVRQDITSGEYYLNRSYTINNTVSPGASLNAQFFFLTTELTALTAVDPVSSLARLGVTKQTASTCRPDFVTANGTNSELAQTANGISSGVSWIAANINGYANYYIHAVKSYLTAKVFLQGAYDANAGRHKDVTASWANVLNTYAKNQPYNTAPYADTAHEGFGAGTAGGRGKPVFHVTNLNASGSGSLLAALGSNRTVVFDIGGTINNFSWYASTITNLTIDGSTAPAPGITLNHNNITGNNCITFDDLCHDIIVKNIRVRNAGKDGIGVINSYNILFDHISVSGSGDGDLDITNSSYNITVQWSIIGAGKSSWSGAQLIAYEGTKDISLHHNLYATFGTGIGERSPFIHNAVDFVSYPVNYLIADFTNNIVWKWGDANGVWGFGSGVDYGGTLQARNNFYQSVLYPANAIVVNPNSTGAKLYATGNVSGNSGVNPNNVSNVATPWTVATVSTQDVCTAATMVIDRAGPRPLDETDRAFINQVSLANCQGFQSTASFGSYTGTESVANGFFTSLPATTDITDWVMIEIKNAAGSILARRAALLREDGQIVDMDGTSPVSLQGLASGNYSITVRHRNHLSIRTASLQSFTAHALGVNSSLASYDFTTAQSKAFQNPAITSNAAMKNVGAGIFAMWGGNANSNTTVRASGPASLNDYTHLTNIVLNGNTATILNNVYSSADMNMDGIIRASGPASLNDYTTLINIILVGNSATIYTEHQ